MAFGIDTLECEPEEHIQDYEVPVEGRCAGLLKEVGRMGHVRALRSVFCVTNDGVDRTNIRIVGLPAKHDVRECRSTELPLHKRSQDVAFCGTYGM